MNMYVSRYVWGSKKWMYVEFLNKSEICLIQKWKKECLNKKK